MKMAFFKFFGGVLIWLCLAILCYDPVKQFFLRHRYLESRLLVAESFENEKAETLILTNGKHSHYDEASEKAIFPTSEFFKNCKDILKANGFNENSSWLQEIFDKYLDKSFFFFFEDAFNENASSFYHNACKLIWLNKQELWQEEEIFAEIFKKDENGEFFENQNRQKLIEENSQKNEFEKIILNLLNIPQPSNFLHTQRFWENKDNQLSRVYHNHHVQKRNLQQVCHQPACFGGLGACRSSGICEGFFPRFNYQNDAEFKCVNGYYCDVTNGFITGKGIDNNYKITAIEPNGTCGYTLSLDPKDSIFLTSSMWECVPNFDGTECSFRAGVGTQPSNVNNISAIQICGCPDVDNDKDGINCNSSQDFRVPLGIISIRQCLTNAHCMDHRFAYCVDGKCEKSLISVGTAGIQVYQCVATQQCSITDLLTQMTNQALKIVPVAANFSCGPEAALNASYFDENQLPCIVDADKDNVCDIHLGVPGVLGTHRLCGCANVDLGGSGQVCDEAADFNYDYGLLNVTECIMDLDCPEKNLCVAGSCQVDDYPPLVVSMHPPVNGVVPPPITTIEIVLNENVQFVPRGSIAILKLDEPIFERIIMVPDSVLDSTYSFSVNERNSGVLAGYKYKMHFEIKGYKLYITFEQHVLEKGLYQIILQTGFLKDMQGNSIPLTQDLFFAVAEDAYCPYLYMTGFSYQGIDFNGKYIYNGKWNNKAGWKKIQSENALMSGSSLVPAITPHIYWYAGRQGKAWLIDSDKNTEKVLGHSDLEFTESLDPAVLYKAPSGKYVRYVNQQTITENFVVAYCPFEQTPVKPKLLETTPSSGSTAWQSDGVLELTFSEPVNFGFAADIYITSRDSAHQIILRPDAEYEMRGVNIKIPDIIQNVPIFVLIEEHQNEKNLSKNSAELSSNGRETQEASSEIDSASRKKGKTVYLTLPEPLKEGETYDLTAQTGAFFSLKNVPTTEIVKNEMFFTVYGAKCNNPTYLAEGLTVLDYEADFAEFHHGISVEVDCKLGYSSDGVVESPASFQCEDSVWLGNYPNCRKSCSEFDTQLLYKVENTSSEEPTHGTKILISCIEYANTFSSTPKKEELTCKDGEWSTPSLACLQTCGEYAPPNNIHYSIDNHFLGKISLGAKRTVKCVPPAYSQTALKEETVSCTLDGWSKLNLECHADCTQDYLPPPSLAVVTSSVSLKHGATRQVECAATHSSISGISTTSVICNDAIWEMEDPLDCRVKCQNPKFSLGYQLTGPSDSTHDHGTKFQIACKPDSKQLAGPEEEAIECINGKWSKTSIQCVGACQNPFDAFGPSYNINIQNSLMNEKSTFTHMSKISIRCTEGSYAASGYEPEDIVCIDGVWESNHLSSESLTSTENENPRVQLSCKKSCSPKKLGLGLKPRDFVGSYRQHKHFLHGEWLQIVCDDGYFPINEEIAIQNIQCLDGTWTAAENLCQKKCSLQDAEEYSLQAGYYLTDVQSDEESFYGVANCRSDFAVTGSGNKEFSCKNGKISYPRLRCSEPSCSDGIKNGNEEGIDCGGSCNSPCKNRCSDLIKNEDEDGIDCGGLHCGSCKNCKIKASKVISDTLAISLDSGRTYADLKTISSTQEVKSGSIVHVQCSEYYRSLNTAAASQFGVLRCTNEILDFRAVNLRCNAGTCSDRIQNNGELGVDCGGPCERQCPSCFDDIKNNDEESTDCGGPCARKCEACSLAPFKVMIYNPEMFKVYKQELAGTSDSPQMHFLNFQRIRVECLADLSLSMLATCKDGTWIDKAEKPVIKTTKYVNECQRAFSTKRVTLERNGEAVQSLDANQSEVNNYYFWDYPQFISAAVPSFSNAKSSCIDEFMAELRLQLVGECGALLYSSSVSQIKSFCGGGCYDKLENLVKSQRVCKELSLEAQEDMDNVQKILTSMLDIFCGTSGGEEAYCFAELSSAALNLHTFHEFAKSSMVSASCQSGSCFRQNLRYFRYLLALSNYMIVNDDVPSQLSAASKKRLLGSDGPNSYETISKGAVAHIQNFSLEEQEKQKLDSYPVVGRNREYLDILSKNQSVRHEGQVSFNIPAHAPEEELLPEFQDKTTAPLGYGPWEEEVKALKRSEQEDSERYHDFFSINDTQKAGTVPNKSWERQLLGLSEAEISGAENETARFTNYKVLQTPSNIFSVIHVEQTPENEPASNFNRMLRSSNTKIQKKSSGHLAKSGSTKDAQFAVSNTSNKRTNGGKNAFSQSVPVETEAPYMSPNSAYAISQKKKILVTSPAQGYLHSLNSVEDILSMMCIRPSSVGIKGLSYCGYILEYHEQDFLRDLSSINELRNNPDWCGTTCFRDVTRRLGQLIYNSNLLSTIPKPYDLLYGKLLVNLGRYSCQTNFNQKLCGNIVFADNLSFYELEWRPRYHVQQTSSYPQCTCPVEFIGDGYCDEACYNDKCGYDGDDCLGLRMVSPQLKNFMKEFGLSPKCNFFDPNFSCHQTPGIDCGSKLREHLEISGCCSAAMFEILFEIVTFDRIHPNVVAKPEKLHDSIFKMLDETPETTQQSLADTSNTYDLDKSVYWLELTCQISLDRTCTKGASRMAREFSFEIENIDYNALITASMGERNLSLLTSFLPLGSKDNPILIVAETTRQLLAEHLSIPLADVIEFRSWPGSLEGLLLVDPGIAMTEALQQDLASLEVDKTFDKALQTALNVDFYSPSYHLLVSGQGFMNIPSRSLKAYKEDSRKDFSVVPEYTTSSSVQIRTPNFGLKGAKSYPPPSGTFGMSKLASILSERDCTEIQLNAPVGVSPLDIYHYEPGGTAAGAISTIKCRPGHLPSAGGTPQRLICSNGRWLTEHDEQLVCRKRCISYQEMDPTTQGVEYRIEYGVVPGEIAVKVTCAPGFAALQGPSEGEVITCANGTWGARQLKCVPESMLSNEIDPACIESMANLPENYTRKSININQFSAELEGASLFVFSCSIGFNVLPSSSSTSETPSEWQNSTERHTVSNTVGRHSKKITPNGRPPSSRETSSAPESLENRSLIETSELPSSNDEEGVGDNEILAKKSYDSNRAYGEGIAKKFDKLSIQNENYHLKVLSAGNNVASENNTNTLAEIERAAASHSLEFFSHPEDATKSWKTTDDYQMIDSLKRTQGLAPQNDESLLFDKRNGRRLEEAKNSENMQVSAVYLLCKDGIISDFKIYEEVSESKLEEIIQERAENMDEFISWLRANRIEDLNSFFQKVMPCVADTYELPGTREKWIGDLGLIAIIFGVMFATLAAGIAIIWGTKKYLLRNKKSLRPARFGGGNGGASTIFSMKGFTRNDRKKYDRDTTSTLNTFNNSSPDKGGLLEECSTLSSKYSELGGSNFQGNEKKSGMRGGTGAASWGRGHLMAQRYSASPNGGARNSVNHKQQAFYPKDDDCSETKGVFRLESSYYNPNHDEVVNLREQQGKELVQFDPLNKGGFKPNTNIGSNISQAAVPHLQASSGVGSSQISSTQDMKLVDLKNVRPNLDSDLSSDANEVPILERAGRIVLSNVYKAGGGLDLGENSRDLESRYDGKATMPFDNFYIVEGETYPVEALPMHAAEVRRTESGSYAEDTDSQVPNLLTQRRNFFSEARKALDDYNHKNSSRHGLSNGTLAMQSDEVRARDALVSGTCADPASHLHNGYVDRVNRLVYTMQPPNERAAPDVEGGDNEMRQSVTVGAVESKPVDDPTSLGIRTGSPHNSGGLPWGWVENGNTHQLHLEDHPDSSLVPGQASEGEDTEGRGGAIVVEALDLQVSVKDELPVSVGNRQQGFEHKLENYRREIDQISSAEVSNGHGPLDFEDSSLQAKRGFRKVATHPPARRSDGVRLSSLQSIRGRETHTLESSGLLPVIVPNLDMEHGNCIRGLEQDPRTRQKSHGKSQDDYYSDGCITVENSSLVSQRQQQGLESEKTEKGSYKFQLPNADKNALSSNIKISSTYEADIADEKLSDNDYEYGLQAETRETKFSFISESKNHHRLHEGRVVTNSTCRSHDNEEGGEVRQDYEKNDMSRSITQRSRVNQSSSEAYAHKMWYSSGSNTLPHAEEGPDEASVAAEFIDGNSKELHASYGIPNGKKSGGEYNPKFGSRNAPSIQQNYQKYSQEEEYSVTSSSKELPIISHHVGHMMDTGEISKNIKKDYHPEIGSGRNSSRMQLHGKLPLASAGNTPANMENGIKIRPLGTNEAVKRRSDTPTPAEKSWQGSHVSPLQPKNYSYQGKNREMIASEGGYDISRVSDRAAETPTSLSIGHQYYLQSEPADLYDINENDTYHGYHSYHHRDQNMVRREATKTKKSPTLSKKTKSPEGSAIVDTSSRGYLTVAGNQELTGNRMLSMEDSFRVASDDCSSEYYQSYDMRGNFYDLSNRHEFSSGKKKSELQGGDSALSNGQYNFKSRGYKEGYSSAVTSEAGQEKSCSDNNPESCLIWNEYYREGGSEGGNSYSRDASRRVSSKGVYVSHNQGNMYKGNKESLRFLDDEVYPEDSASCVAYKLQVQEQLRKRGRRIE